MKKLMYVIVSFLMISAIHSSTYGQSSLKFINGIELNPESVEFVTALPVPEISTIAPVRAAAHSSINNKLAIEKFSALQFRYAQILDTEIERLSNLVLFRFIDEWWETRYRYGGTSKKGIDCSALTGLLLSTVYAIHAPRTARQQYASSEKISRDSLTEGDLVFFNTTGGVSHVGMYLANDYFVHASSSNGVTISNLNDSYYSQRYIGGGRMNTEESF